MLYTYAQVFLNYIYDIIINKECTPQNESSVCAGWEVTFFISFLSLQLGIQSNVTLI